LSFLCIALREGDGPAYGLAGSGARMPKAVCN
jgi:hypothetical protein